MTIKGVRQLETYDNKRNYVTDECAYDKRNYATDECAYDKRNY